jgi:hypothetical protein
VLDRVGDRLPGGEIDPVADIVVEPQPLQGVVQDHLDELDVLQPAFDGEVELMLVGAHSARPRRGGA